MSNFIQALARLQAGDLKLLVPQQTVPPGAEEKSLAPCGTTSSSPPTAKKRRRRRARVADDANPAVEEELSSSIDVATATAPPEPGIRSDTVPAATAPDPLAALSSQEFTLPTYTPPEKSGKAEKVGKERKTGKQGKETAEAIAGEAPETDQLSSTSTDLETPTPTPRLRRHVQHEWPAVGVRLTALYHGQTYNAEIISAVKRLKSGKQVRLLDGPARGRIYDSLSEAMLAATEKQRRDQHRGRSGVSSGWTFWAWPGKGQAAPSPDSDVTTPA